MEVRTDVSGLPLLEQFSEEGFIDCVFAVKGLHEDAKYRYFHRAAAFRSQVVGLDVRDHQDFA